MGQGDHVHRAVNSSKPVQGVSRVLLHRGEELDCDIAYLLFCRQAGSNGAGGDGDQEQGQDEGLSEEGCLVQLEGVDGASLDIFSVSPTISFPVTENGQDDHQVLEEARNQRGRSAPRDVGSRRGDDAEGQPEEEGQRLRHLFCPGPRSASSRVSVLLLTIYLLFTMSIIISVTDLALTRKLCKKWRKYENSLIASN